MFQMTHELFPKTLLRGIVTLDGDLYFRAVDVARIMGAKNPRLHAKRITHKRIPDLLTDGLPNLMAKQPAYFHTVRVLSLKETIYRMGNSTEPFANLMAHKLQRGGRCLRNIFEEEPTLDFQKAPRVVITLPREDPKQLIEGVLMVDTLGNFFGDHINTSLEFYLREEFVSIKVENNRQTAELAKVSPSSHNPTPRMDIGDSTVM